MTTKTNLNTKQTGKVRFLRFVDFSRVMTHNCQLKASK
jgi:hypothetical protein